MKCRPFTIRAAISLLLLLAVVGLWVRTMFVGDKFFRHL
jgi:hypothetical protein